MCTPTILLSYLFKPFRTDYLWGFRINSVLIASTLIVPYFLLAHSYYQLLTNPFWLFRYTIIIAIMSIPMAAIYFRNERDSDFAWVLVYELFWILTCQWIMPYAFLTCWRQGAWITRGETQKIRPAALPAYVFKSQGHSLPSPVLSSKPLWQQAQQAPQVIGRTPAGNLSREGYSFDRERPPSKPWEGRMERPARMDFPINKQGPSL